MIGLTTTRINHAGQRSLAVVVLLALLSAVSLRAQAQQPQQHYVAPAGNTAQPRISPAYNQAMQTPVQHPNRAGVSNPRQHLGEWMISHGNLPLDQQQRALEREPGFQQLRPEVQQHMRDRLTQLNNMTPERRQQAIARTEAMERLSPEQRQEVRSAAGQLGSLPEDRRRAVAHAFHDLRAMPEQQRQQYLNSPQYRGQFSDQERDTLNHLLYVSPYLPVPQPQRPVQTAPYPVQPQY